MTVLERIKDTCRERKNISVTTLEQELGYSNGSLAKAKDIPSSRISEISKYLGVSMDYLMTGTESEFSKKQALLDLKISQDLKLKSALEKYFSLSEKKQKHVIELIELLAGEE